MARDPMAPAVLHVRYAGVSRDLPLEVLGLTAAASDAAVFAAVARHLEVPASHLDGYVVERHVSGNMTVRPEAVFG